MTTTQRQRNFVATSLPRLLANPSAPIIIISGEGTGPGHIELFTGRRTARAVLGRISREHWAGRWARAEVWSHRDTDWLEEVFVDVQTGEMRGYYGMPWLHQSAVATPSSKGA